jgi:hypothetical protein
LGTLPIFFLYHFRHSPPKLISFDDFVDSVVNQSPRGP